MSRYLHLTQFTNRRIFLLILITLQLKVSKSTPNLLSIGHSQYSVVQTVKILVTGTTLLTKLHSWSKTWSTPSLVKSFPSIHRITKSQGLVQNFRWSSLLVNEWIVAPGYLQRSTEMSEMSFTLICRGTRECPITATENMFPLSLPSKHG